MLLAHGYTTDRSQLFVDQIIFVGDVNLARGSRN